MSRPKGSRNRFINGIHDDGVAELKPQEKIEVDDNGSVSIFEAAQQLEASEHAIKVWVDHGHLTSVNGRITVRSIRECRFNTGRFV